MLNWFRSKPPTPPVDEKTRLWIEKRFAWFVKEFGLKHLRKVEVILPTTDYFPGHYHATEEELAAMLGRVGHYMGVDPGRLRLNFYHDEHPRFEGAPYEGTAGLYTAEDGFFDIWIEMSGLDDPLGVVGTMAHEVGHVVLLGERRVHPSEEDHEPLTDLVTVFLGMGLFTANSVVKERNWRLENASAWQIGRHGYLTMNEFGYALALFALAREEEQPAWAKYMRPDVKGAFRAGVRYKREGEG